MTENLEQPGGEGPVTDTGEKTAKIVYILYLLGLIFGITPLIGLIMAYMNRGDAGEVAANHYRWQIRTFWIVLLYSVIGAILTLVLIGLLVLLATAILMIVRCVKGLQALERGEPVDNVESWLW